jgi:DNA repair exonuclease SbcCD nuclease subunit
MKIYHAADIHLGRRRLDGRLPCRDIADAFRSIADAAIQDKADVFLLAGDLFDRPQVEPPHLRQAQEVLTQLKRAEIPVLAIEGNHDKQFVNTDAPTWVDHLAQEDLLVLLRPEFHSGGVRLPEWNAESRTGAWLQIQGVRFVGAGYLGAATPNKVRQILAELAPGGPQVLLLHAGPEYFVGEGGGFGQEDLQALKQKVCYLALGHIHKPMVYEGWACNPGSPENCELREAAYAYGKDGTPVARGYTVVEIDPAQPNKPVSLEVRSNPRRPVTRVELDCTPFGSKTKHGAEALVAAAVQAIQKAQPAAHATIDLILTGTLNLNRIALDQTAAAVEIAQGAGVYVVSIDTTRLNVGTGFGHQGMGGDRQMPRDELERQALLQLLEQQPLWGLTDQRKLFADLFYDLKQSVQAGRTGEEIAGQIATSALVDPIRLALTTTPRPATPATLAEPGLGNKEGV